MSAAREGLLLWFLTVMPSLLPFIIGINLLLGLGVLRALPPGGVAFVMGLISGYPMGAKTVGDLCRTNEISPEKARRLLGFCNNAGPLFIVGAVGVGMFGDIRSGYILWAGHVLGALTIAILGRLLLGIVSDKTVKKTVFTPLPLGKVLGDAVKNAMEAMALVGGLIILFNVAVRVVLAATGLARDGYFAGVLGGFFEISGGARVLAAQGSNVWALALAAGVIGFGGLSVHAQALYFASGTGVRTGRYLLCKLLHGVLAAAFTVIIWFVIVGNRS